jgi:hypothetical protein
MEINKELNFIKLENCYLRIDSIDSFYVSDKPDSYINFSVRGQTVRIKIDKNKIDAVCQSLINLLVITEIK